MDILLKYNEVNAIILLVVRNTVKSVSPPRQLESGGTDSQEWGGTYSEIALVFTSAFFCL